MLSAANIYQNAERQSNLGPHLNKKFGRIPAMRYVKLPLRPTGASGWSNAQAQRGK